VRVIGVIAASAGPGLTWLPRGAARSAPRTSPKRRAWRSTRTVPGTAPWQASRARRCCGGGCAGVLPSGRRGRLRFWTTLSGPLHEPVSRPDSVSHFAGRSKPACEERPKPGPRSVVLGTPGETAPKSRFGQACRGPKLTTNGQARGRRSWCNPPLARQAALRASRGPKSASSLRRGRGPSSPANRQAGLLFVPRRGRWPLPPRQQHSPRAVCMAPGCRHDEKFPKKPGFALESARLR